MSVRRPRRLARRENLLHADELVLVGAEADLLGVLDAALPVRVGVRDVELVVRVVLVELAGGLELVAHARELGVRQRGLLLDGIDAGLVERDRVEARKEADVTDDGLVVLVVAVAVGAHVNGQADVEARAAVHDGLGVLGDLVVKHLSGLVVVRADGVLVAHGDAAAAAHALAVVDAGHVDLANLAVGKLMLVGLVKREGAVGADLLALAAPDAPLL